MIQIQTKSSGYNDVLFKINQKKKSLNLTNNFKFSVEKKSVTQWTFNRVSYISA